MSLDGKWRRVACENADGLIKELGITEEILVANLKAYFEEDELMLEFQMKEDGATRKTWHKGNLKEDIVIKYGEWTERASSRGTTKILGTKVSNSRIEVIEEADGRPSGRGVIYVDGDKLIVQQIPDNRMSLDGKWRRVACDNADGVIKELGITEEIQVANLKAYFEEDESMLELQMKEDGGTRKTWHKGNLTEDIDMKFGEWIERAGSRGNTKILGTKVSSSCIEVIEEAEGRPNGRGVLYLDGDKLIVEYTVNSATMKRTFERI